LTGRPICRSAYPGQSKQSPVTLPQPVAGLTDGRPSCWSSQRLCSSHTREALPRASSSARRGPMEWRAELAVMDEVNWSAIGPQTLKTNRQVRRTRDGLEAVISDTGHMAWPFWSNLEKAPDSGSSLLNQRPPSHADGASPPMRPQTPFSARITGRDPRLWAVSISHHRLKPPRTCPAVE
jgi:hypothetical protein